MNFVNLVILTLSLIKPPCNSDIAVAAESLTRFVIYDPNYAVIDYPNGDVAPNRGVCTDVVIRTLRKVDRPASRGLQS